MKIKKAVNIDISSLVENENNPNQMSEKELNKLCENIVNIGFTEPIMVGTLPDGKYEIVSGHHRYKAAKSLGMTELPAIIYDDWTKEKRDMIMVKMNIVRGKISPDKFVVLFQKYAEKYGEDIVKGMMGFSDEAAFRELYRAVKSGLPEPIAKKLDDAEARGEIETVGELERALSTLFSEYGDTVPCNFMFFVHGGKKHVMQKTDKELWDIMSNIYKEITDKNLDSMRVLKSVLSGWRERM